MGSKKVHIVDDLMPDNEFHPQLASPRVKRTSKATFRAIIDEGLLSKQRLNVYKLLFVCGPLTGREVNQRLETVSGHKRLSELKRLDVVDTYGSKTCGVTGRHAEAWDVTGRMPLAPEHATSPHPKKRMLQEVSRGVRLAAVLRKRPVPAPKEDPKDFMGRYLVWLNQDVALVLDDIEEESDAE